MINPGDAIDNWTICDLFGVANMGGIRVNRSKNLIVLISNNTDPIYRNDWKDNVLHFVGRGSIGPQKLDRQNFTLAKSKQNGAKVHLFEVWEKGRYTYSGEVELADEPYLSDQTDAQNEIRFVWLFPIRRKLVHEGGDLPCSGVSSIPEHLPFGAYAVIGLNLNSAQQQLVNHLLNQLKEKGIPILNHKQAPVIGSDLSPTQIEIVHQLVDQLKEKGIPVLDQRGVEYARYEKAMVRWNDDVLTNVRSAARKIIADERKYVKSRNKQFSFEADELEIRSNFDQTQIRGVLDFIGREGEFDRIIESAQQNIPMPDPPGSFQTDNSNGDEIEPLPKGTGVFDPNKFKDVT
jgi:hypothetical protein